jgi:hypothetical protein
MNKKTNKKLTKLTNNIKKENKNDIDYRTQINNKNNNYFETYQQ